MSIYAISLFYSVFEKKEYYMLEFNVIIPIGLEVVDRKFTR